MAKLSAKIKNGYYIKARKIQDSEISRMPPYVREIWDWLLKEANHKDVRYGGFEVKRGQLFRRYKDIREGLAWYVGWRKEMYDENQTKKAMKALREARMVDTMKARGGVLITIVNYDYYQDADNYESTRGYREKAPMKAPSRNQPLPENNKKEKKEKKEDSLAEQSSALISSLIKSFEDINPACKRMYGNKTQRQACSDLIEAYSYEKVKQVVENTLPKTKGMEFFPTITTPKQLFDKWSSLETAVGRYKARKESEINKKGSVFV